MSIDYGSLMPEARDAMVRLQGEVQNGGLEENLLELVKIRSSQLNGCAYCLDMHTKDARAIGESEQRLHVLAAWREAPFYSNRERAALAWCEALTLLPDGIPEDVRQEVSRVFTDREVVALTFAVVAINGWNRLAVGLRSQVGEYVSMRRPPTGLQRGAAHPERQR
ncbi:MAG: carboxymuconolactone decarboxylase family protein [Candidatus Dormiibacterota bacterium]